MDCTNPIFNLDVKKELDLISEIEEITRNLTFDLHNCRAVNIKDCFYDSDNSYMTNPTFFFILGNFIYLLTGYSGIASLLSPRH